MVCAIEQYEHCCSIIIIIALQFNTAQWQCAGDLDPRMKQHVQSQTVYRPTAIFCFFSRVDF